MGPLFRHTLKIYRWIVIVIIIIVVVVVRPSSSSSSSSSSWSSSSSSSSSSSTSSSLFFSIWGIPHSQTRIKTLASPKKIHRANFPRPACGQARIRPVAKCFCARVASNTLKINKNNMLLLQTLDKIGGYTPNSDLKTREKPWWEKPWCLPYDKATMGFGGIPETEINKTGKSRGLM